MTTQIKLEAQPSGGKPFERWPRFERLTLGCRTLSMKAACFSSKNLQLLVDKLLKSSECCERQRKTGRNLFQSVISISCPVVCPAHASKSRCRPSGQG